VSAHRPTSERKLNRLRAALDNRRQRKAYRAALRRVALQYGPEA
jgi:hypothetical protein